jgi:hypothetical protein
MVPGTTAFGPTIAMTIAAAGSAELLQQGFDFDPGDGVGWCIGHPA